MIMSSVHEVAHEKTCNAAVITSLVSTCVCVCVSLLKSCSRAVLRVNGGSHERQTECVTPGARISRC